MIKMRFFIIQPMFGFVWVLRFLFVYLKNEFQMEESNPTEYKYTDRSAVF